MLAKRLSLILAAAALTAGTAQAQNAYPIAGGGLQYQIGGGLPLPIQLTSPAYTGTNFPPLLVPPVGGTTAPTGFILQTTGPDPKDITAVYPVMSKPAGFAKIGVWANNSGLYQVATNLSVVWPNPAQIGNQPQPMTVHLAKSGRTGANVTTWATGLGAGSTIKYSTLGQRFGGPAQFSVGNPGTKPAGALFTGVNATIWLIPPALRPAGFPPCAHPAFGGANPACVAALGQAVPGTGTAVWGAPTFATVNTPGGLPAALATNPTTKPKKGPKPGVMVVSADAAGLVLKSAFTGGGATGFTNMASSTGFPWTTGMITLKAPLVGETFTITGMDTRVSGVGTIQLVSGTLSRRAASGPNANRAWLSLNVPEPSAMLATGAALALLGLCHGLARRRSR